MDPTPRLEDRPRKRRAINACVSCRASKVRCDGKRPCARCDRNETSCVYHEAVRDGNVIRIERLEADMAALRDEMRNMNLNLQQGQSPAGTGAAVGMPGGQGAAARNVVDSGMVSWEQAVVWFESFFSGSHYLVPIFCSRHDTIAHISCHAFLFDAIVSVGCRVEQGFSSSTYRQLQTHVREHLTNLLISTSTPSHEDVQAITLMAAYSDNGFVLIALAMRFAIQLGLPDTIDQLMAYVSDRDRAISPKEQTLYRLSRLWLGICNFELFFSLDGGKIPSTALQISPRKIRTLVHHPSRTEVDIRLLSQIELNVIRTEAYSKIGTTHQSTLLSQHESHLQSTINSANMELTLWLDEWTHIITTDPHIQHRSFALQNLHIQRDWALLTLSLKAISASGIENIAIMSEYQRDLLRQAKEAATRHLRHALASSPSPSTSLSSPAEPTYLSTFKYTLDYVWAKCTFCVLIVLKLAILVRDPVSAVMALLQDAHALLEELKRVAVGHSAYFQILQTSIEKCEAALREHVASVQGSDEGFDGGLGVGSGQRLGVGVGAASRVAEDEFQGYVPAEFVFEWDFPGLRLKFMPLGWHDLFINIENLF